MRHRRGWQRCGCVLVSVCLVSWVGLLTGCESSSGKKAEEAPPTATPPSPSPTPPTTPTPPTPPPPPTTPLPPTPPSPVVVDMNLTAGSVSLVADGSSSTTITAELITSTGAPASDGTTVTFSTDLGRFDSSGAKVINTTTSRGTGIVTVPFISEAENVGTATITARVQGVTESIQVVLGPVLIMFLEADPPSIVADGASSTTITATLFTDTGVPAPNGTLVTFTTDLGRFTTESAKQITVATARGLGQAIVPFISDAGMSGTATIVASAQGLTQSIQVTLTSLTGPAPVRPGPVFSINLTSEATSLLADGNSSMTISALLITTTGSPAPDGTLVTFTTDLGHFTTTGAKSIRIPTTQGTGTAIAPFISEAGIIGTANVVASAGILTQSIRISLVLTTPPTAPPTDIAGITLATPENFLPADGISSTTITAQLITSTGVPVPDGIVVAFTTDLGQFTSTGDKMTTARTGQGGGIAIIPFISEAGVVGTATVIARASAVTQLIQIGIGSSSPPPPPPPPPGTVVGISLVADSPALVANGTTSTTITATLITFTGAPAPDGVIVSFTTDKGRFSTDGAKTASATTQGETGTVVVPFISEAGVVGTATVVASFGGVAQSIQIALTGPGEPAQIILTADATTIPLAARTGITAQVLDEDGNNVADGTAVTFTTSLNGTGVTPIATTTDGVANAIFSAGTQAGVATVTATARSASAVISITIQAGLAGSLEFVSADPILIGVRGSALPQKSTITFRARDVNGNPVADGTQVTFTLISGLGGGEALAPNIVGTVAGLASTVLTSGTVSGPVRVLASVTVGSVTLTSSSTNVSIAGGPPSGAHMGVAPAFRNIAGLVTQGIICPITAIVGDRFGNPVPQNTAVSFLTNGGVVTPQGVTDALGNTVGVEIKTGPPTPHVGTVTNFGDPRTGLVTVIAVTQGEETFIDSNGNGLFDGPGEFEPTDPEIDTPEPFIDHVNLCNGQPAPCPADAVNPPLLSGNGVFDPDNRFELFIDGNGNGGWDTPNGVWDANKPIFATTTVLFTGPTQLSVGELQPDGSCSGNPSGFKVEDKFSSVAFCFLARDPAGRPLVGGTQISVTTSAGAISGTSNLDLPDTQRGGPGITFFTFAVVDDDPGDTDPAADALVTVSITSPSSTTCPGGNGNLAVSFPGTVD